MDIPAYLETQIREGKVVLFLGAGASFEAKDAEGHKPPNGRELGEKLSERFLGGNYSSAPLSQIGEYSISESDLTTVQEFIRDIFEPFQPTEAHCALSTFRWRGIATTNYDLLVERAYKRTAAAIQTPVPFIENGDRVDDLLRDPGSVPYLKLHGCITRLSNPQCPLILTTDQYIQYREGRSRLFDQLKDLGCEHSIVFIGHSLQDSDIRTTLFELTRLGDARQRYYFVAPDVDEIQTRFWESKYKVTPIKAFFADFVHALDDRIPATFRGLSVPVSPDASRFPISERFTTADWTLSAACKQFLETDVTYMRAVTATDHTTPEAFYRGFSSGWSGIEQNLDVRRHLGDTLLSDHFLAEEAGRPDSMEFVLIKAHAGAGKSVLLRRIAWDAARDFNCACLYLNSYGVISGAAIQELITLCRERLYLFVDNVADHVRELLSLAKTLGPDAKYLTVIGSERTNEWNVSCSVLSPLVTRSYELRYLSEPEIDRLLALLEQHRTLGTLVNASAEERREAFVERAGRQLLVALHEATRGVPFEDIIADEFETIVPHEAQQLYLTVCVLNRLNVPVRAGLIARIHGISFEDFQSRLFRPLEHVVYTKSDPILRDYLYCARHPHIAEIVFERILTNSEQRCEAYLNCLGPMNIDYDVDRKAFRQMIRGRSLLEVLCSPELIERVYTVAKERVGKDAYLLHQMALYEMHRPDGNLQRCGELLKEAEAIAPRDRSIKHSMAEYYLKRAEGARSDVEAKRCLDEAAVMCCDLKRRATEDSYAHHTLAKVELARLRRALDSDDISESYLEATLKGMEQNLADGLQKFPGDAHLLSAEASLATFLADSARALHALEKAFSANPRNAHIASQLSRYYVKAEMWEKAEVTVKKAIEAKRNDKGLHFTYARLLMERPGAVSDDVLYHLRRSFAPGDTNYQARLLYGRQLFIAGKIEESRIEFHELAKVTVPTEVRDELLYELPDVYRGQIARPPEATYCFIERDGRNDWIFAHRSNIAESTWKALLRGTRVTFRVAFRFRGPGAFDVQLESPETRE